MEFPIFVFQWGNWRQGSFLLEAFFDFKDAGEDVLGGFELGVGGVSGAEDEFREFAELFGFATFGVELHEAFEIGIAVGRVDLDGEIEEVDAFIDAAVAGADFLGGDHAGVGHFSEHTLDLAGAHHFFEEGVEERFFGEVLADADGRAEVDEADAVGSDDEVVETEIEVDDFGVIVQGGEELGGLLGELNLGDRRAAVAEPVEVERADVALLVLIGMEDARDEVAELFGEIALEKFEDGGFTREEYGEYFFREFAGAAAQGFKIGFGKFVAQAGEHAFRGGDLLDDFVFGPSGVFGEHDVVGEAVGRIAGADESHFAGDQEMDAGFEEQEAEIQRIFFERGGGRLDDPAAAPAPIAIGFGGLVDGSKVAADDDYLAAPAQEGKNIFRIVSFGGRENQQVDEVGEGLGADGVGGALKFRSAGEAFFDEPLDHAGIGGLIFGAAMIARFGRCIVRGCNSTSTDAYLDLCQLNPGYVENTALGAPGNQAFSLLIGQFSWLDCTISHCTMQVTQNAGEERGKTGQSHVFIPAKTIRACESCALHSLVLASPPCRVARANPRGHHEPLIQGAWHGCASDPGDSARAQRDPRSPQAQPPA